ncbi:MAG: PAS domain S-box protein [Gammaproteobacteria bacterium]|nr:PAS domain S-box protein [Gammaproteobacteria bacterium]NIR82006.1 PAS domain S-box protein [Gammaproteobacteria bacterium]NIR89066.1 PAS domain S-box protein [Gammaproteobacteria bacterium]NIU03113.1 PAS domain S-box protein [Gammaproteobacteria bacterium]NIX84388.1 PAS domain S-box protein [Gammaproteobacteria bacterium]
MPGTLSILVIDDDASDRALASLVLRQSLPDAHVEEVDGAIAFAEHLARSGFSVVVTESEFSWSEGAEVLEIVRRRHPDCALVVFSSIGLEEVGKRGVYPDIDAFVRKSSAGYLELPEAIRRATERAARRRTFAGDTPYRTLVEGLPVGVFSLSASGLVSDTNPAASAILGFATRSELRGRALEDLFMTFAARGAWRALLSGEAPVNDLEVEVRRASGDATWVRLSAWPVTDENGKIVRFEGTIQDILPYKEAQAKLSRQAEALKRSNEELEEITYALSHDLQEPLQLVSRYAHLIAERYGGELDAEARPLIEHLTGSAERMQSLIDAVLDYSRLGTEERRFKPLDLGAAVDEAVENLRGAIDEVEARVEREDLPTVMADDRQIVQLFQNLIGNAIKFRGDEPLRIRIAAQAREDEWLVSVEDNGIGVEPRHAERIFAMFQRLHTQQEYPGTGIGLAVCKKIVQRHGGEIWVRSEPSKGSTFYLTLPKAPADDTVWQN